MHYFISLLILFCLCIFRCPAIETSTQSEIQSISSYIQNKVIFFIGYPGSGKGTQGKKLSSELQINHLSTGELFRAEAAKKTPIGLLMDSYMQKGEIIPKEITFEYLKQELSDAKYRNGIILDGYPKNLECCDFILQTLNDLQFEPIIAFYFDIPRSEVVKRLSGRLHCKICEHDFHVNFLPPKKAGVCDYCGGPLEQRKDDTVEAINKRLDVFEKNTFPVIEKFTDMGILIRLDATKEIEELNQEIINIIGTHSRDQISKGGSYYMRLPKKEKSVVFHNHIDAESHLLLREVVGKIENNSLDFQNKIYPVSYLTLGSQVKEPEFSSVYQSLPNFHSIENATDEAFSTGKMGDDGFNYDQVLATLEVAEQYPNRGVMTELEEDIYDKTFDEDGQSTVVLDRGCTPYTVDWQKLPNWKERQIDNVPKFELHHGFDIPKITGEENPPIDVSTLCDITEKMGFNNGGWFVFRKDGNWSYRSNEFSNENFEENLKTLNKQADDLRTIVQSLLQERKFTSSCSLEKVHAMWRM